MLRNIAISEIKYYLLRYNVFHDKPIRWLMKMEIWGETGKVGQTGSREKIEIVLQRLQVLKSRTSELRLQLEELRQLRSEEKPDGLVCSECGEAVEQGQEVAIKDSSGALKRCYHKECFEAMLR